MSYNKVRCVPSLRHVVPLVGEEGEAAGGRARRPSLMRPRDVTKRLISMEGVCRGDVYSHIFTHKRIYTHTLI
ncbi:hypothetical protein FKM82_019533 [Ascaphus truei]